MEDGADALQSVEDKLAGVFASEVAHEQGASTPEPEAAEQPDVLAAENVIDSTEIEEMQQAEAPEAPDGQLRDPETGQFTTEDKLYAGRYKSVEELERAVTEKQEFIDRQANELGMLRRLERLEQSQAPAPQAQTSLPANFADLLDEDPARATELAYRAGDDVAIQQAYAAWNEIAPGAPNLWVQNKQMEQRLEELSESFGQQTSQQVYSEFVRTHPDVETYEGDMAEVIRRSPAMAQILESGTAAEKVEILDLAYIKVKSQSQARNADTLAKAQGAADAERDAILRQQKETAAVASATRTAAEKKPLNEGQQMLESIRAAYGGPDILSGITTD